MRIQVTATFLSPLTNRMLKIGEELNVEKNRFWLKRVEQKDVKKIAARAKAPPKQTENKKQYSTADKKK